LESACAQTYENIEIIVSDNASPDATEELVRSIGHPRVRYHRHPTNIGAGANANSCIERAQGKYFQLLQDDDAIDPDFVEVCMQAAMAGPEPGLIRTGTRIIDDHGGVLWESPNLTAGLTFDEFVFAWLAGKTSPYLPSTLFLTEPLKALGFRSRHDLYDDLFTEFRIAAKFPRVDIADVKASFRKHPQEAGVRTDMRLWCEESLELLDLLCELVPQRADEIRHLGLRFLAYNNYRRALRRPTARDRVRGLLLVFAMHDLIPPPPALVAKSLLPGVDRVKQRWQDFQRTLARR
jgi:hypothetical protein